MIDNHRIISMIKSIFHFSYKENKVSLVSSMVHLQSSFGKSPEVLNPVDMTFTPSQRFFVLDTDMVKSLKIKSIICPEAIRIHPGKRFYMCLNRPLQRLLVKLRREYHFNFTIAFQKAKYRDFASSTSAAFPFSFSAKICFVNFDLPRKLVTGTITFLCHKTSQLRVIAQDRLGIHPEIFCNSRSWYHQPEQSDDLLNHLPWQAMPLTSGCEFLAALFTFPSAVRQYIQPTRATFRAMKMPIRRCHKTSFLLWHFRKPLRAIFINHSSSIAWST